MILRNKNTLNISITPEIYRQYILVRNADYKCNFCSFHVTKQRTRFTS